MKYISRLLKRLVILLVFLGSPVLVLATGGYFYLVNCPDGSTISYEYSAGKNKFRSYLESSSSKPTSTPLHYYAGLVGGGSGSTLAIWQGITWVTASDGFYIPPFDLAPDENGRAVHVVCCYRPNERNLHCVNVHDYPFNAATKCSECRAGTI